MCLSLAASSFATSITHLVLLQGVLYGIGGCLAFTPSIIFMNEWFVKRRGFAFGLVWVRFVAGPIAKQRRLTVLGWLRSYRYDLPNSPTSSVG